MGDPARELADALQATRLVTLLLVLHLRDQGLLLALRLDAIGHVPHRGDRHRTAARVHRGEGDLGGELGAVAAQAVEVQAGTHRPRPRVGEVGTSVSGVLLPEALRQQHLDPPADELLSRVAEQALGLLVHQCDLTGSVDAHDRVRRELEELLEETSVGDWRTLPLRFSPSHADAVV